MKKLFIIQISIITALSLIICLAYISVVLWAYNLDFYRSEYAKNGTYEAVNMSESELMRVTSHLTDYLRSKTDDLQLEAVVGGEARLFFSERELLHMIDVKIIIATFAKMFYLSLSLSACGVIILVRQKRLRIFAKTVLIVIGVFAGLVSAIAVAAAADFDSTFTVFHEVFFSNELWLLDPNADLLINIVPEQFFMDIAARIAISFTALLATLCGLLCFNILYQKQKTQC